MSGYLYCFSNESMLGVYKVGMTERTPIERLNDANCSDTWRPPTPYVIEFYKKVSNVKEKEIAMHKILEKYTNRINPKREFFRASLDEIKAFFDLMDGISEDEISKDDENNDTVNKPKNTFVIREMSKCFNNGQSIRHKIDNDNIWIGKYDIVNDAIFCNDIAYSSMSAFAAGHIKSLNPDKCKITVNGWKECEYDVNGNWVSTKKLGLDL